MDTTTRAGGVVEVVRDAKEEGLTIQAEEKLNSYGVKPKIIEGSTPSPKNPQVQQLRKPTRSRFHSHGNPNAQVLSTRPL